MADIEAQIAEKFHSGKEKSDGAYFTNNLDVVLRGFLDIYDFWKPKLDDKEIIRNKNNFSVKNTVADPSNVTTICWYGADSVGSILELLTQNELLAVIEEELNNTENLEFTSQRELITQSLHFSEDISISKVEKMSQESTPFVDSNIINNLSLNGLSLLSEAEIYIKYFALSYVFLLEQRDIVQYADLKQWELRDLHTWSNSLVQETESERIGPSPTEGDNDGHKTDGGTFAISTIIGTTGQIVAGAYAVGHDSFIDPNISSIIAGTGLVASGLEGWPDDEIVGKIAKNVQKKTSETLSE